MRSATRAGWLKLAALDDAVAQADARVRWLAAARNTSGARVRVLLEEVVLDLPHVVDAQPVRELDLLERVLEQPVLGVVVPRAGQLVLVEDAELYLGGKWIGGGGTGHRKFVLRTDPGRAGGAARQVAGRCGRPGVGSSSGRSGVVVEAALIRQAHRQRREEL